MLQLGPRVSCRLPLCPWCWNEARPLAAVVNCQVRPLARLSPHASNAGLYAAAPLIPSSYREVVSWEINQALSDTWRAICADPSSLVSLMWGLLRCGWWGSYNRNTPLYNAVQYKHATNYSIASLPQENHSKWRWRPVSRTVGTGSRTLSHRCGFKIKMRFLTLKTQEEQLNSSWKSCC